MGEAPDDGKIRVRCTGCGKRVKFPKGTGGEAYRCPVCHKTIVAPLSDKDMVMPTNGELRRAIAHAPQASAPSAPGTADASSGEEEAVLQPRVQGSDKNLNTIERLTAFLAKESAITVQEARETLGGANLGEEETIAELRQLRHDRAVRLSKFAEVVLRELDAEIESVRQGPVADTASGQNRLQLLLDERKAFLLYLKAMFELRSLSAAPGGGSGAPAAASEPPSTPSTQGPRTP